MVFWIAILAGILFAWLAVKKGFYESLIQLFNVVVSIYVAIFVAPMITGLTPAIEGGAEFKTGLCMLLVGGGCFALLFGISFVLLTGQFHIAFPRVLDIVVAGALGFVTGFLILSFIALILTVTPLSNHRLLRYAGLNRQAQQPNITWLAWCCDRVHAVAGINPAAQPIEGTIVQLLERAHQDMISTADPNVAAPAQPVKK
jgi:hypothetical protein